MATFTPFTWIRHGRDISVATGIPGSIQEELWFGDYGDTFDIVTSFGTDNGPATRAFDPQSLVYQNNPNSLVPYLSSATMFTGFKQGAFDVARGDLVQNTLDPIGTLDENGFSGTIWDSVKHLSLDVDIYQLPSLHDSRTFLLSTTPFTVDTKSTENGVVTSQTHEVGVYEGANPVSQLIGQFIEWKRIDKDTGAQKIEYQYIWAGSGSAFREFQQGYGGWRFKLEGLQDQVKIDHVQDGLLMQRRFMIVGGYANDGLASWYAQGGADSSTMPSPGINSPDADWFVPVGLGQYTLISDSSTPNLIPIQLEKQTNNWHGNADGGVTGGTIGTAKSDFLIGTGGVEWLKSKAGNDLLEGKGGGDKLEGGTGFDIASYVSATVKVTVSLKTPSSNTGDARGDSYYSIEGVFGSNFGDTITGNDSANYLAGGLGHDKIIGLGRGTNWWVARATTRSQVVWARIS